MTLSQLFVLSPRGDTIIFKDFRGNVAKARTGREGRRRCCAVAAGRLLPLPVRARPLLRLDPPPHPFMMLFTLQTSTEVFFRKAKFWDGQDGKDAPPAFHVNGVQYLHVKVRPAPALPCAARTPVLYLLYPAMGAS